MSRKQAEKKMISHITAHVYSRELLEYMRARLNVMHEHIMM
jgi:hypothetical protein